MTRRFSTGAEESSAAEVWSDVDQSNASTDDLLITYGSNKNNSILPRTGRAMYSLLQNQSMTVTFSDNPSELYLGMAINLSYFYQVDFLNFYVDTYPTLTQYDSVRLLTDGKISVTRSGTVLDTSTDPVFTVDTWYYMEVWCYPRNSSGRLVVKIDGVTVIDYTGDTTNDQESIDGVRLYGAAASQGYRPAYYDDIVINDEDGSYNNTYPGMVRLLPIRPQDAGNYADWTRASVDLGYDEAQARNGAFEFTMLQTSDADDLVTFTPELPDLPAGATIENILINARARVESGAGVIAPMVRSNGTDDISADQTLQSNWLYHQYAWPLNPDDSAAWDEADLANLEIGVSS